jgi:hypothetical protein
MRYSSVRQVLLLFVALLLGTSVAGQSRRSVNREVYREEIDTVEAEQCDQLVSQAKSAFMGLLSQRQRDPSSVSVEDLRAASIEYVSVSEKCYRIKYGYSSYEGTPIDDGPRTPPGVSGSSPMDGATPEFITYGTKWGAGSPFHTSPPGFDVPGPRLPGGEVTYSFMPAGLSMAGCSGATSDSIAFSEVSGCWDTASGSLRKEIKAAFAAWELVADITFREVADSGHAFNASGASGDIRICAHSFSGSTLAHAYVPPTTGAETTISAPGDLHFNSAVYWECDPGQDVADGVDLGIVAIHEIGHAIGLLHEGGDGSITDPNPEYAIMNTPYDPSIDMPLADDIEAAESIYGSPKLDRTFWGDVGIGTDSPDTSLHVLRSDGTAKLLVEEASGTTAPRFLFELSNNGGTRFSFKNSDTNKEWFFSMNAAQDFTISFIGTGGAEMSLLRDGTVLMGPGPDTTFDLDPLGNLTIAGWLTQLSDRHAKENFLPLDSEEVLEKITQLPITEWNFKQEDDSVRHIGPVAQDFQEAFGLGKDERHISSMDMSGVALAAIQGLNEKLQEKDALLVRQQQQIENLRAELAEIKAMIGQR